MNILGFCYLYTEGVQPPHNGGPEPNKKKITNHRCTHSKTQRYNAYANCDFYTYSDIKKKMSIWESN